MRPQAEWKVMIHAPRAAGPSIVSTRSRISPAALFVNVIARISFARAPAAPSRCAIRWVSTRVLPEPAPAITSSGPSVVVTASRWAGFRPARYVSGEARLTRPMLAAERQALPERGESGQACNRLAERVPDALADVAAGGARDADGHGGERGKGDARPPRERPFRSARVGPDPRRAGGRNGR